MQSRQACDVNAQFAAPPPAPPEGQLIGAPPPAPTGGAPPFPPKPPPPVLVPVLAFEPPVPVELLMLLVPVVPVLPDAPLPLVPVDAVVVAGDEELHPKAKAKAKEMPRPITNQEHRMEPPKNT